MAKLGDICTLVNGYAFKPSDWSEEGVPIIRIQNLNDENAPFNYYSGKIDSKYNVSDGDLLFAWSGTPGTSFGAFFWNRGKGILNQHIFNVHPIESIDKPYFRYALNGKLDIIISKAHGGVGLQHITKKELENIDISVPPLETQKQISATLDKATQTIDLCNAILEKLDLLVKARFVEMFGDFKYNTKKWDIASFDTIATIDCNMTTDFEKYSDYPHIGIDCIEKGTGELSGYKTVAEDNVISGKYIFTPEHIIYSKIRPNLNKVAMPTFYGVCSADAYPILPKKDKCNRVFLVYVMRSQYFLDYILQFCNRTNLPKVNKKEVSGFATPLPPLELQNQFAAYVEKTDRTKAAVQQVLAKAETLKKALMQEYFG